MGLCDCESDLGILRQMAATLPGLLSKQVYQHHSFCGSYVGLTLMYTVLRPGFQHPIALQPVVDATNHSLRVFREVCDTTYSATNISDVSEATTCELGAHITLHLVASNCKYLAQAAH